MKHFLKNIFVITGILITGSNSYAQNVGIGTASFVPDAQAQLEIQSTTSGVLLPRMTDVQRTAIVPTAGNDFGLLVYQTNTVNSANSSGYWYWDGTAWARLATTASNGWTLAGNAGTNPSVNFIGTTDAADLVFRTSDSERARILNSGEARINTITVNAGEIFTVFANGVAGALVTPGTDAINGYSAGAGIGVYGENTSNGTGVWGVADSSTAVGTRGDNISATTATGSSYAIIGSNTSVPSVGAISIGSAGFAGASSGDARGVNGQSSSTNGIGVAGFNTAAMAANVGAHGVFGQTTSQSAYGVAGVNTATLGAAHGVQGQAQSPVSSAGVRGVNLAFPSLSSHAAYGVRGSSQGIPSAGAVYGVRGDATTASGTAYGVSGFVITKTGFGVIGSNNATTNDGTGVVGNGNNVATFTYLTSGCGGSFNGTGLGMFALAQSTTNATGLLAASNGGGFITIAGGSGISASSSFTGVAGWASTVLPGSASMGGYFDAGAGTSYAYVGAVTAGGVVRKIEGNGTVNTTVKDINGKSVVLSAPEAPENLFQDFGTGILVNGKAHITLDPTFSKNIVVDNKHTLRVFIQLRDDCKGVYVSNETVNGFDVNELQNGNSNAKFNWFVTANRADELLADGSISHYSSERFAPALCAAKSIRNESIQGREIQPQSESTNLLTVQPLTQTQKEKKKK